MASPAFEQIIQLTDQLSTAEREALIQHLQQNSDAREGLTLAQQALLEQAKNQPLNYAEWSKFFDAAKISHPLLNDFSDRREDWYGDEGR